MEQAYVDRWLQERQRLRAFHAECIAQGVIPLQPGPITDSAAEQYGQVQVLRDEIRANAGPAPAYDVRHEADVIGDLLFADGGGKNKHSISRTASGETSDKVGRRPYPFGPMATAARLTPNPRSTAATQHEQQSRTSAEASASTGIPSIVASTPQLKVPTPATHVDDNVQAAILVYHGSYAPMHVGHRECIHTALRFLALRNVFIEKAIVGFTTAKYVQDKTPDGALADVQHRYRIASQVLSTGSDPISPITLDPREHSSAYACAQHLH
eukprot:6443764-Amphidinium_carterae.2